MLGKFRVRSSQKELMDDLNVPVELLHENLNELDILNRKTYGHRLSYKALKRLIKDPDKEYHIVDLGCGSGDSMVYMAKRINNKLKKLKFTGVDNNSDAINYLKAKCRDYSEIKGVFSGFEEYFKAKNDIDIVHCSLFCHHLDDNAIENLLRLIKEHARVGFIINDLIRSPISYYFTKLFTQLANATPLAKNDGPISVLRGFRHKELKAFFNKAGIVKYNVRQIPGYRFVVWGYLNKK